MMNPKHQAVANTYSFSPGPDGANLGGRPSNMDPAQRLSTPMAGAAPWQQFTPDQIDTIQTAAGGRWQTDSAAGATANMNRIVQDNGGTTDVTRVTTDPYQQNYVDLGGHGARDVAVGRV